MGTLVNGIKEIFATSQTTATHLPVCASDGTPQGRISVGDLASVLGVYSKVAMNLQNKDLNDIKGFGWYTIGDTASMSITNMPKTGGAILNIVGSDSAYVCQTLYYKDNPKTYQRMYNGASWSDWKEVTFDMPLFYKNYSDIASLATSIGTTDGGIGILKPSSHYSRTNSFRDRLQGLSSANGVYTVASTETDAICFGNTQMFVYADGSTGKTNVDIRVYRNGEWGNKLNIFREQ